MSQRETSPVGQTAILKGGIILTELLKLIAPGTPIRDGLENILRAKTGALLLITDDSNVIKEVVDGGFYINEEYTSSKLYELAKMDGAIVLSRRFKTNIVCKCTVNTIKKYRNKRNWNKT